jgi:hypothetical protein
MFFSLTACRVIQGVAHKYLSPLDKFGQLLKSLDPPSGVTLQPLV